MQGTRLHFLTLVMTQLEMSAEAFEEMAACASPRWSPRKRSSQPAKKRRASHQEDPPECLHRREARRALTREGAPRRRPRVSRDVDASARPGRGETHPSHSLPSGFRFSNGRADPQKARSPERSPLRSGVPSRADLAAGRSCSSSSASSRLRSSGFHRPVDSSRSAAADCPLGLNEGSVQIRRSSSFVNPSPSHWPIPPTAFRSEERNGVDGLKCLGIQGHRVGVNPDRVDGPDALQVVRKPTHGRRGARPTRGCR